MSVKPPPIKWVGCSAHNFVVGRPTGIDFEAIFKHTTAGGTFIEDLDGWFNGTHFDTRGNLIRGSTQLGIGISRATGKVEVHQYVRWTDTPIAQGQRPGFTTGELFLENSSSANVWGIGQEHVDRGIPGNHSPEILEMSAWVDAWLFQEFLFKSTATPTPVVSRRHILGHYQADGRDRPFCPSWPEQRFTDHIERVKVLLAGEPEPLPPDHGVDWAAAYGRLLDEVERWMADDAAGAEMRAARLHELNEVN